MTPKEQADGVMKLIRMMPREAVQELAWLLHERSETARDRLGSPVCVLFELTGGMFRIEHIKELENRNGNFQDSMRWKQGVIDELIPPAAVGGKSIEGGKRGRTIGGDTSKREAVRAAWMRIQQEVPGLPITATRKRIEKAKIASMTAIKEHTKDLAAALKKKRA